MSPDHRSHFSRRKLLASTVTGGAVLTAGCTIISSDDGTDNETNTDDDRDYTTPFVLLDFSYDLETADLTLSHAAGETLTPENTGYISITGDYEPSDGWNREYLNPNTDSAHRAELREPLPEETVIYDADEADVEPGDSLTVEWVSPDDDERTLTMGSAQMPVPEPHFDMNYLSNTNQVVIAHAAGDTLTGQNTGVLEITGDYEAGGGWDSDSIIMNPDNSKQGLPVNNVTVGTVIYRTDPDAVTSGDTIGIEWESPGGTHREELTSLEIP